MRRRISVYFPTGAYQYLYYLFTWAFACEPGQPGRPHCKMHIVCTQGCYFRVVRVRHASDRTLRRGSARIFAEQSSVLATRQVPYFPPLQSPADFDEVTCLKLIRAASGVPGLSDIQVKQVRPWTMSAQVAGRWELAGVV